MKYYIYLHITYSFISAIAIIVIITSLTRDTPLSFIFHTFYLPEGFVLIFVYDYKI